MDAPAGIASRRPAGTGRRRARRRRHPQPRGAARARPAAARARSRCALARVGLAACDPARRSSGWSRCDGDDADRRRPRLRRCTRGGRVVVLGSGKASLAIAAALERVLGDRLEGGLVVVRDAIGPHLVTDRAPSRPRIRFPTSAATRPPASLLEHGRGPRPRATSCIACFTGGSSALDQPAPGRRLRRAQAGAAPHAARLRDADHRGQRRPQAGLRRSRAAGSPPRALPARVVNLTVSDVAGDPLDAITDPTVANTSSTPADAVAVLSDWALWDDTPPSIRAAPRRAQPPTRRHRRPRRGRHPDRAPGHRRGRLRGDERRGRRGRRDADRARHRHRGGGGARSAASSARWPPSRRPSGALPAARRVLLGCGGESTVRLGPDDALRRRRPEPRGGARRRDADHRPRRRRRLPRHRRLRRRRATSPARSSTAHTLERSAVAELGSATALAAPSLRRGRRCARRRDRDGPDPHQRQRPLRDRDRRGGRR